MMLTYSVLVLVVVLCGNIQPGLAADQLERCPRPCFCNKKLTSVNCAGKQLTRIPHDTPTKVEKLYLDHNRFLTIPSGSFHNFTNLQYLDLRSNVITSLPQNAFTGAHALTDLYLSTNEITDIDVQAFDGVINLKMLNLAGNKLKELFCLSYTPNLQTLVMEGNALLDATFPVDTTTLKSLYDIILSNNQISNLTSLTFLALENAGVKKVEIARNNIAHIAADTLSPLTQIQSLKLAANPLTPGALVEAFSGIRSETLASLDISQVKFDGTVDSSLFEPFQNITLRNLKLNLNTIHKLTDNNFHFLTNLLTLDLTGCQLQTISTEAFYGLRITQLRLGSNLLQEAPKNLPSSLQKLYLENNQIKALREENFANLKGLQELYLGANSILTLEKEAFYKLTNLRKLHLVANKIATLPGDLFSPLQNLVSLSLNKNNLQQIPNESGVFSIMTSLQYLNIADNFCKQVPQNIFNGMNNLLYLHLENNLLGHVIKSDQSGQLFHGLHKLQELYLGNNDIAGLPESIFRTLSSVVTVKMQDNRISHWGPHTFEMTKKLETLDISNNYISLINETSVKDLKTLKNLNLTGNPFDCNCDLRWFRDWLNQTNVDVKMLDTYQCNLPPSWQGKPLLRFKSSAIDCTDKTPYYIGGSLVVGFLVTFVVTTFIYKYRWFLKLKIHRARVRIGGAARRKGYEDIPGDNKRFDAYISCCESDGKWVLENILKVHDNGSLNGEQFRGEFKLCYEHRDFLPGSPEVVCIDECMSGSRKILVVLSRDYLRDSRCNFEVHHAFHMVNIDSEVEELILIKKGRLRVRDMPRVVSRMIASGEFLEWTDDEDGVKNFEETLNQKIREKKPPNIQEI